DARGSSNVWEEIVQAALCWTDVADSELFIAVNVFSMLPWAPMCAFRACHVLTANAFERWAAQPQQQATLSWVRIPNRWQSDCLRFVGQHCRNVRHLAVFETPHFGEKQLLRLVCGMRFLEFLEVDASSFGGNFPDPQRVLDRLAKYCPRLQHIVISFRQEVPSERTTFEVRTLAWLGRRLLTLDLGAVAVRIWGGTRTIAACCPQLQRLGAQLCHQTDAIDPNDIARGCPIQELDLAPVDWDDRVLESFVTQAPYLRRVVLRHVEPHATAMLLVPLVAFCRTANSLVSLHLALHARTDRGRANHWLQAVSHMQHLRSLCLDYAAPLGLAEIISSLGHSPSCTELVSFTVHGCHGVDDDALQQLVWWSPRLEQVRLFPDSWREVGTVSERGLLTMVKQLPLRSLAVSSRCQILDSQSKAMFNEQGHIRSLSLFAPLSNSALSYKQCIGWRCLRYLWLGPHKLMQRGVGAECEVDDHGLQLVVQSCHLLQDLTVASCLVTNAGFACALLACRELRRLRLGGAGITDDSLHLLATVAQPRLERLSLWFSGVSSSGLLQARAEMPWTYFDIEVADAL
ncbi:unnamed protein product, partial [Effrenium voratum]